MFHRLVLALACLSQLLRGSAAAIGLSETITGTMTFYGGQPDGMDPDFPSFGTKEGSCGYGQLDKSTWPFWSVGALATSNSFFIAGPIQGCGQCFEVRCMDTRSGVCKTGQPVYIVITDMCPECETNHLDVQARVFEKIAQPSQGRVSISFRRVSCSVGPSPVPSSIVIDLNSNNGKGLWGRLTVQAAGGRGSVSAVALRTGGTTSWSFMTNKYGAAWEIDNMPPAPLDVLVRQDDGQQVIGRKVVQNDGASGKFALRAQFC